jgi:hypothetical protein
LIVQSGCFAQRFIALAILFEQVTHVVLRYLLVPSQVSNSRTWTVALSSWNPSITF